MGKDRDLEEFRNWKCSFVRKVDKSRKNNYCPGLVYEISQEKFPFWLVSDSGQICKYLRKTVKTRTIMGCLAISSILIKCDALTIKTNRISRNCLKTGHSYNIDNIFFFVSESVIKFHRT